MGSTTAAGSTLAISATAPATQDAAGFAATSAIEIGGIDKIGTFGATFEKVEFKPLKGAVDKHKGSANYGALQPSMAVDDTDAGQTLVKTAAADATSKLYTLIVTLPTGAKRGFQGRVFGFPETIDGADSILMASPTIEICTKPVPIPAP